YLTAGAGEDVRIELPVGRYVPNFRYSADVDQTPVAAEVPPVSISADGQQVARRREFIVAWFALAVLTLVLSIVAYAISNWGREAENARAFGLLTYPHVRVLDFQTLGESNEDMARA